MTSLLFTSAILWDVQGRAGEDGSREKLLEDLERWGITADDLDAAVAAIAEVQA